jgi:hypothetical protein
VIHLHSVYSHDACDGDPMPGGAPAQPCHQHLRDGLCRTHADFAMLTDHDDSMADAHWESLFLPSEGDEPVTEASREVASWMRCADGTRVLVTVGGENALMPVGLEGHVAADLPMRHAIMTGSDRAAADAMRAAGAVVLVPHTESRSLDELRAVEPEGMEVYNLHANLDPKIRTAMGLDPFAPITAIAPFLQEDNTPEPLEPDLALLAFIEENPIALQRYHALLGEGRRVTGTLGLDAHENAIPLNLADGERADGYRRLMRWFATHLLVSDLAPDALKDALRRGRAYGVFHLLGDPIDFDWRAEQGGDTFEAGDEVRVGATLVVDPPRLVLSSSQRAPVLRTRVVRVAADGTMIEVAVGEGAAPLRVVTDSAGAYRVEVRMTPHHLVAYMGALEPTLLREYTWIIGNPIYVR